MNAVMPQSHGDDHAMPGVLHSRKPDDEIEFYAFDMLVSDGDVIRKLSLSMRKTNLARLLGGTPARRDSGRTTVTRLIVAIKADCGAYLRGVSRGSSRSA